MEASDIINSYGDPAGFARRIREVSGAVTKAESAAYQERFVRLIEAYGRFYRGSGAPALFTAPGRTEICGNHTDHQHGRVLAASVNLDIIAAAERNDTNIIRVHSEGFKTDTIDLSDLSPHENEKNHSASLIRGIAQSFAKLGYEVGGFNAYTSSNVLKGSGLSSSAAFEVLIGNIINTLFAGGKEDPLTIAKIGQYAENHYYGKPCGLMDQTASSVGSVMTIDFADPAAPVVDKIDFDFASAGYSLVILDSGADHKDLTQAYAAIPEEMRAVARVFGQDYLRDVSPQEFYAGYSRAREAAGDRAVLRAAHYFADDERVRLAVDALRQNDMPRFLTIVIESGRSSYMYLQNVFAAKNPKEQAVAVVLQQCERLLAGRGAWRVHGGGFAGTVQAFVPELGLADFLDGMAGVIGQERCHVLRIRSAGGVCLFPAPGR